MITISPRCEQVDEMVRPRGTPVDAIACRNGITSEMRINPYSKREKVGGKNVENHCNSGPNNNRDVGDRPVRRVHQVMLEIGGRLSFTVLDNPEYAIDVRK